MDPGRRHIHDLATPALVVDVDAFEHNVATMAAAWPGERLRPHVKAFKSTALAAELAAAGHRAFCCATTREVQGMAAAGLGHDLLLANEVLDVARLRAMVDGSPEARVTVAVDSLAGIDAAAQAGVQEVLVDVDVGLPRCGCEPADAGRLAQLARERGLGVRGVMGYEGHLMMEPEPARSEKVEAAMATLLAAHAEVGGEVVSGGGTGTWRANRWVTELQAGSYTLMDTQYGSQDHPFRQALHVLATVVSVNPRTGHAVADAGLKAMSLDHGNPTVLGGEVWFCSDEHTTFAPQAGHDLPALGSRVRIAPSHVDPTVACHELLHLVRGDGVLDVWPVDLRGW